MPQISALWRAVSYWALPKACCAETPQCQAGSRLSPRAHPTMEPLLTSLQAMTAQVASAAARWPESDYLGDDRVLDLFLQVLSFGREWCC